MWMKWCYRCPKCNEWGCVDWEKREKSFSCHACKQSHVPPTPSQDHQAYVDTHDWPEEMEAVVVALKGKKCTVPNCPRNYDTLDHRIPYSKGGKTSVSNLYPMCNLHNESKGDSDYYQWLQTLK